MRLTKEARDDSHGEQKEEPRTIDEERCAQREERQGILSDRENLREQPNPACGLLARSLQLVVEGRVFKLIQVERCGMLHQTHAGMIREEITKKAFDEGGGCGQHLAQEYDAEFNGDQFPKP